MAHTDSRSRRATEATPSKPETWAESFALLPRRAVFVAVAVVQIVVELVATAVRDTLSAGEER
jgi:hypothetical protein